MKFIHTGDSHIGEVYKDRQRNEDIKDAFRQVIDAAIDEKADFIIHSGDLFDTGVPSFQDMLFVTDQLKRLKEKGIKMFIVPGSHDIGLGEETSVIELFDRNDLLVNLNSSRYIKKEEDKVLLKGEVYKNAFIAGIRGKRSRVEDEIFKRLKVEMRDAWIKIFVFHHTISALGEPFSDLDTDSLPKGFDYYAAGHWHGHRDNIPYGKGIIQYPGSTEYCDEKEIVDYKNRGFYVIDYNEKGIGKISYSILKTREKEILHIDANGKTAQKVREEIGQKISENDGKILVIRIDGKLNDKRSSLDIEGIKQDAKSLGYSYVSVNISRLSDKSEEEVKVSSDSIEQIEKEFLEKKGYSDKDIAVAKLLIDAAETGLSIDETRKKTEELYKDL